MSKAYGLTSPLSRVLDKPRADYTREDMLHVIGERGIQNITFRYTALDGKLKELRIPVTDRLQAERVLADGERVDGSSLFKGMVDTSVSDMYVVPVYKSAFLNPFDDSSLDFLCRYVTREGSLASFAPDTILHRAGALFREHTGFELRALGELEFFLLRDVETNVYASAPQRGYHSSAPFLKSAAILDEMVTHIARITGAVKYAHSEVGCMESVRSDLQEIGGRQAEQLEIEFLPTPVEDTGDILVLSRWIIRNVAFRHNCVATFTPKLEEGVAGNGLHVHLEVLQNGKNIMTGADGRLSDTARMVIGGLCTYADSLTAFGNTVSSAYLRLVPNQEAPTRICWSDLNRSAMIRVPLAWSGGSNLARILNPGTKALDCAGRQTVELRSPDGSAMIHPLLAGITMACEWGLSNDQSLATAEQLYVSGNIFNKKTAVPALPALPGSCVESARILRQKRDLYERSDVFPPSMIDYTAALLDAEEDEDMNRTLMDLPADDRLLQTRRIMHKDLHRH